MLSVQLHVDHHQRRYCWEHLRSIVSLLWMTVLLLIFLRCADLIMVIHIWYAILNLIGYKTCIHDIIDNLEYLNQCKTGFKRQQMIANHTITATTPTQTVTHNYRQLSPCGYPAINWTLAIMDKIQIPGKSERGLFDGK